MKIVKRVEAARDHLAEGVKRLWDKALVWGDVRLAVTSIRHAEDDSELTLGIPGYRQLTSYHCGYVAGLNVLRFFYPRKSWVKFLQLCKTERDKSGDGDRWTSETALVTALRASRIRVRKLVNPSFDKVADSIDNCKPLIACVDDHEHWVLIYGYGVKPKRVFVANRIVGPVWRAETVEKWMDFKTAVSGGIYYACSRK